MVVRPRELRLETPYFDQSIKATRHAYQLDAIRTTENSPIEANR